MTCLVNDGRAEAAQALLESRLDRRPSPLDAPRLVSISTMEPSVLVP